MSFENAVDDLYMRMVIAKDESDWTLFWDLLPQYQALLVLKSQGFVKNQTS